jgi:hypothetical protein
MMEGGQIDKTIPPLLPERKAARVHFEMCMIGHYFDMLSLKEYAYWQFRPALMRGGVSGWFDIANDWDTFDQLFHQIFEGEMAWFVRWNATTFTTGAIRDFCLRQPEYATRVLGLIEVWKLTARTVTLAETVKFWEEAIDEGFARLQT